MKKIYILQIEYDEDTEQIEYVKEEIIDEDVIGPDVVYIESDLSDLNKFDDGILKKLIDDGVLAES